MARLLSQIGLVRPDAVQVWRDDEVNQRLYWYRQVMVGSFPAKFMLCRKVPVELKLVGATESELWAEHEECSNILSGLVKDVATGSDVDQSYENPHPNLLDLKAELVNRMLSHCNFCEWNCKVNRAQGKVGFCRIDKTTSVDSYFHHYGEEAPLIGTQRAGGSGTIFFESCDSRCQFCQNWTISQPKTMAGLTGEVVSPLRLAEIADELAADGAGNINYVGGEPTVDLHTIISSLPHMKRSVPLIWNSNMYCSMEAMKLLADVVDLWLPDFKFWKDECARRLMCVGAKAGYPEVARRNHVFAADHGSMIVRHLVMPNHLECCTKPILQFISETIGDEVLVNVMSQYYPANVVARNPEKYPDIARRLTGREIQEAYAYARHLGLQFEQVS